MSAMGSIILLCDNYGKILPAGLGNARQIAVIGQLPETDAAQFEIAHEAVVAAAAPATIDLPGGKFRFSFRFDY
jgi:hypothetical protein